MPPSPLACHWTLDPGVHFLNHGSFGACPRPVLEHQAFLRAEMEREPLDFLFRRLEGMLHEARQTAADFVGCPPETLVFVRDTTEGVNAVLRSFDLAPGDELLVTDHEYNACRNALDFVAARAGARVVVADLPFPVPSADSILEAVLSKVTPRTRLLLIDHITSATALVLPLEGLVSGLEARGIPVLVDGAHAAGMIDLDVASLGASFYTGNFHKWVCSPKGSAFLHVRSDRQASVRPLAISHGANSPRTDRSRFLLEFDWTGTGDPTPWLCVPEAIRFLGSLLPGGWTELRARNRALALEARRILSGLLSVEPPCPDAMIGSMASLSLPPGREGDLLPPLFIDPLQDALRKRGFELPVWPWPTAPGRIFRVSAQLYNDPSQYEALGIAMREALGRS